MKHELKCTTYHTGGWWRFMWKIVSFFPFMLLFFHSRAKQSSYRRRAFFSHFIKNSRSSLWSSTDFIIRSNWFTWKLQFKVFWSINYMIIRFQVFQMIVRFVFRRHSISNAITLSPMDIHSDSICSTSFSVFVFVFVLLPYIGNSMCKFSNNS